MPTHPPPLDTFLQHLTSALADGSFSRLILTQPSPAAAPVEKITGRLIRIREAWTLSLTLREARRDTTLNLPPAEAEAWIRSRIPSSFRSAVLETLQKTWQLSPDRHGSLRLATHRPQASTTPSRQHDLPKNRHLDTAALPWLARLGICTPDGQLRASFADKHRQLERYLEITSHLMAETSWKAGDHLAVVDMGCGKGYLTFAIWHLLNHRLGLHATVTGVERQAALVAQANATVQAIDARELTFTTGTIADTAIDSADILIALHACNTATDDALRRGLAARSRLILLSPCCHQEVRPQLGAPEPVAPLLAYGIMAERFAEWITDGLRALHLERAGYRTKLIEFVASEHTPRNLLLAAVRLDAPDPAARARATDQILRLKAWSGLQHQALDVLLDD